MFICEECNMIFSEPRFFKEDHGETMACCPSCNGTFVEAQKCSICGEFYNPESSKNGCICCEDCEKSLEKRFSKILHDNFSDEEIAVLNSLYDGRDLK